METAFLGLDPLFSTNVKILIGHIHTLKKSEIKSFELYHFYDHLITLVDLCAIIVGVERTKSNIIYTLDDGSGTIACVLWDDHITNRIETLELGALVRVFGKIHTNHEEKHINIQNIFELKDPNEELAHWTQIYTLEPNYREPYKLPQVFEGNKEQLLNKLDSNSLVTDLKAKEITLLKQDKELNELAKSTISPKIPSKRKIKQLFDKAIMTICKKGLAMHSERRPGMYELIDSMALTNFIISILSDALKNANSDLSGVRLDYIKTRVSKEFTELNSKDIVKVVDDLCCNGLIYCCGYKEYKLLSTL